MATVLVIGGPKSNGARAIAQAVQRMGHETRALSSVEGAKRLLHQEKISVMIAELRSDSFDLLRIAKMYSRGTQILFVAANASASDYQRAIDEGALAVLAEPVDENEVQTALQQALGMSEGTKSIIHELSLIDLLQILHMGQRSVTIKVLPGEGRIHLSNGQIVHASYHGLSGRAAMHSMLALHATTVVTGPPTDVEQTIDESFEMLLLDLLREIDERRRITDPPGHRMVSVSAPSFPPIEPSVPPPQRISQGSRMRALPVVSALAGAGVMGVFFLSHAPKQEPVAPIFVAPPPVEAKPAPPATETKVLLRSMPSGAKVSQEGVVVGVTPFILIFPLDEAVRKFKFEVKGHRAVEVHVRMTDPRIEIDAELDQLTARHVQAPPPPNVLEPVEEKEVEVEAPEPPAEAVIPDETKPPPAPVDAPPPAVVEPRAKPVAVARPTTIPPKRRGSMVQPEYSQRHRSMEMEGDVIAEVSIDADGRVSDVSITKSSGHSELDHAARQAAKKDTYSPATRGGLAVPYQLIVKYSFHITDDR